MPDLDAAMTELIEMTGVRFGEPVHDCLGEWPYSLVFTDTAPHIELIVSVSGSPWETDVPRFHHLGWWTSCLPDTVDSWSESGGEVQFDGREHRRRFVYVDAPRSGVRLEAVDAVQREGFLRRWTQGKRYRQRSALSCGSRASWPADQSRAGLVSTRR